MGIYQTLLSHKIIIFLSICLSQISLRTKTDTFTAKKSLNLSISAKIRAKQQLYVCTCETSRNSIYLAVSSVASIHVADILPVLCHMAGQHQHIQRCQSLLSLSLFPKITTYMRFMNTPILIKFLILCLKIIQDIRIRHFLNNQLACLDFGIYFHKNILLQIPAKLVTKSFVIILYQLLKMAISQYL